MHVSAAFLRAFQSVLIELGVPEAAMHPLPADPNASLPWDECVRRLSFTLERSGDPFLGLRVGERISVSALNVAGHILATSRNMRETAEQYGRFAPLVFAGAAFTLEESSDEASYGFTAPPVDAAGEAFCADLTLTIVSNVVRGMFVARGRRLRVELRHPGPEETQFYEQVFGARVVFNAEHNRVVFPRAMIDETKRIAPHDLQHMLSCRADELLAQRERSLDVVKRVREALSSADLDTFDLARAAQALGMGTATLRRRLADRGTAFSQIVDEVRRELACDALKTTHTDIKQLSARLGFSEPRAFHRAFRRWTGTTPARFRAGRAVG